jgi:hypothetical protein
MRRLASEATGIQLRIGCSVFFANTLTKFYLDAGVNIWALISRDATAGDACVRGTLSGHLVSMPSF